MAKISAKIATNYHSSDFGYCINSVVNCFQQFSRSNDGDEFIVDLSTCNFIPPILISGLATIYKEAEKKGSRVSIVGTSHQIDSYFQTINFPNGFDPKQVEYKQEDVDRICSRYTAKTYVPIFCVPIEPIGNATATLSIRERLLDLLSGIITRQINANATLKMSLQYFIAELTNNIVEHSFSETGMIIAQSFTNLGFIDISIVDFGIGLQKSYLRSGKFQPSNDTDALEYALTGSSTKDLPESRGFGIPTTRHMLVTGLGGKFAIITGHGLHIHTEKRKSIIALNENLHEGCFYVLRIPLQIPTTFDFYKYVQ